MRSVSQKAQEIGARGIGLVKVKNVKIEPVAAVGKRRRLPGIPVGQQLFLAGGWVEFSSRTEMHLKPSLSAALSSLANRRTGGGPDQFGKGRNEAV
jgi:hypothetical protein